MNETPRINPYFALIIGVISISTSAVLVKAASAPSGVVAFYRLFFTVLFMLPVFLYKYVGELRHITKKDWFYSIISGVFLAMHFILWFESLNYTSIASSTVLVTIQPLFSFIGSYFFFKERFSGKAIISCALAILGSVMISWSDFRLSGIALYGDVLALTACVLITAYMMFGQAVRQRLSLITYTFVVYAISTAVLFVYVVAVGEPLYPYSASTWIYYILLAIFPTLLGHSIFNWSLKWISAATVSMAILFEPFGAAVLAYYFFEEKIIWTQALGGFIVIGGIMLYLMDERKIKVKKKEDSRIML
nr:DMT family transporter [uncultured Bacillus sp.]